MEQRAWERINMALENLVMTGPAPVIMRPFAGIYNPFPYRCSVLCNHPADVDIKNGGQRGAERPWGNYKVYQYTILPK